jgi:hypothetical protein
MVFIEEGAAGCAKAVVAADNTRLSTMAAMESLGLGMEAFYNLPATSG